MSLFTKQALSQFSELDYEVYHFILENTEKIAYMTIREMASEAHVSTTTITRFCRKLNCEGFSEFKVRYKLETVHEEKRKKKFDNTVMIDFLQRANTEAFQNQLEDIAKVLSKKTHLIFLGVGNSGIMADYASRYFCNMGIFAAGVNYPIFPINLEIPKDAAIVVLSVEGEVETLLNHSEYFRKSHALIVSITNSKDSTIAKISDYNISYYIQREAANEGGTYKVDITSQIPAMYIIESLAKLVGIEKQKKIEAIEY